MEGNKTRVLWLVLLIIGICLTGFGIYKGFSEGLFDREKKPTSNQTNNGNNSSNGTNNSVKNDVSFNGVYEKDSVVIKLYLKDKKTLTYDISYDGGETSSTAKVSGNSASDEMFDSSYKFTITENGLEFTTNNEDIASGTYAKKSEYTVNDYFTDNYGDAQYVNSKYNGEYKFGDIKAYMFQSNEKEVRLYIYGGLGMSDLVYEIGQNDILTCEHFDDKYEVTFTDSGFTFKVVEGEKSNFEGTYTKVKAMTLEEIVETFN